MRADSNSGPAWTWTVAWGDRSEPGWATGPTYVYPGFLKEILRFPAGMLPAGQGGELTANAHDEIRRRTQCGAHWPGRIIASFKMLGW